MAAFLTDITPFYGTGEKNQAGQTLEEFLEIYNPRKYETPACTTDAVIFSYESEENLRKDAPNLKLLLVKRSNHPSIGYWALPGGFANMREDLDMTARRELEEETGVTGLHMEQLAAYGKMNRDPRTRVITTAYMALVRETDVKVQAGDDAADAAWCRISVTQETGSTEEPVGDRHTEWLRLHVQQPEKGLDTKALIKHTYMDGLIREESYEVVSGGMIAVDHAAIIVQAYETIRMRMR